MIIMIIIIIIIIMMMMMLLKTYQSIYHNFSPRDSEYPAPTPPPRNSELFNVPHFSFTFLFPTTRSIGVVMYVMLSGVSPFLDESIEETCSNIVRRDYCFPDDYFAGISQEAKDLINFMLVDQLR